MKNMAWIFIGIGHWIDAFAEDIKNVHRNNIAKNSTYQHNMRQNLKHSKAEWAAATVTIGAIIASFFATINWGITQGSRIFIEFIRSRTTPKALPQSTPSPQSKLHSVVDGFHLHVDPKGLEAFKKF
ncbi:MAG: hypothetical protein ACKO34_07645 [Vampirovibrionales bacterium]